MDTSKIDVQTTKHPEPSVTPAITVETTVSRNPQHLATKMDGKTVLVELGSGKYFSLNAVGSFVWERLEAAKTVASLCDAVCEAYEVDRDRCESDVLGLLTKLADAGLVQVTTDPP